MEITKQSLPRRIISLLLALAIMIGFVPVIDIDLTAFAADGGITLEDSKDQSGENWTWDYKSKTLSLYNAYINPTTEHYAFKYEGTDTLIINQIGYNLIGNGYIEAESIKVIGSGILDIQNWDTGGNRQMFKTNELILSNGYITSSGGSDLAAEYLISGNSGSETITISNCVLDVPDTTIVAKAKAQETEEAGFVMNSGYVNCKTLKPSFYVDPNGDYKCKTAQLNGGYLKTNTMSGTCFAGNYHYIELRAAVVKADTWKEVKVESMTNYRGVLLVKTVTDGDSSLDSISSQKLADKSSDGYDVYCFDSASKQYASTSSSVTSVDENYAYYFDCDYNISNCDIERGTTTTIVCANGKLTLDNVHIDGNNVNATVYANELKYSSDDERKIINGCTIGGDVTLKLENGSLIGNFGRLYCTNKLTLDSDCIIEGDSSNRGAVTVYSTLEGLNTKTLNFNDHTLTVRGDFSVKASSNSAPFAETEKNIVVSGEYGQFAAAYSNSQNSLMIDNDTFSTIAAASKEATEDNNRTLAVYSADNFGNLLKTSTTNQPKSIYIGDEFAAQLIALTESANIICKEVYGDSAEFEFLCSHDITDLDTVDVTVAAGGSDYTDKFDIDIDYVDEDEDDKSEIKLTFALKENIDTKDYTVTVTVDGLTATGTLKATNINVTLDFTKADENAWWFFGDFDGAKTECAADPDANGNSVWEWYPEMDGYPASVLVLNNLDIHTIADNAIIVPIDTTIIVKGKNNIQSKLTSIVGDGGITIVGEGTDASKLTTESDNAGEYTGSGDCTYGAGIYAKNNGDITVKNCTLEVNVGDFLNSSNYSNDNESNCYGISGRNVTFINADANIEAGKAYCGNEYIPNNKSAAVYARNDIEIRGTCHLTLSAHTYALQSGNGISISDLKTLDGAYESDQTNITENDYLDNTTGYKEFYTAGSAIHTEITTEAADVTVTINDNGTTTTDSDVKKYSDYTETFEAPEGKYIKEIKYTIGTITDEDALFNYYDVLSNVEKDADNRVTKATFTIKGINENCAITVIYDDIEPYITVSNPDGNLDSFAGWFEDLEEYISITYESVCKYNEQAVFRFTAKDGYYIKTLTVDGVALIVNGDQDVTADTSGIEASLLGIGEHIDGGLCVHTDITYKHGDNDELGITHNSHIDVVCEPLPAYTVTITNDNEKGTITDCFTGDEITASTLAIPEGSDLDLNFIAESGYYIKTITVDGTDWVADGKAVGNYLEYHDKNFLDLVNEAEVKLEKIQQSSNIVVVYEKLPETNTITITSNDINLGAVSASGNTAVNTDGENLTVTVVSGETIEITFETDSSLYYIKTLSVDGFYSIGGKWSEGSKARLTSIKTTEADDRTYKATLTFDNVSADSTIYVEYADISYYNITLLDSENGTVTFEPSAENGVKKGTTVTATATPDSGYELTGFKVNGTTVTPDSNGKFSFTVTNTTTVEVTFNKKQNSGGSSHIINGTDQLPALDGAGYNYKRMAEVLTTYEAGSTATIEVNGNYNIPDEVIKAIADGKLKVTIVMDSTTSRYVDGADIQTVKSVDAEVRRTYALDTDELSGDEAMQLILFNFDVPSDLIVTLKEKNAGLFANLYKYTNGEFEFADCAIITKDGKAVFEDYTTNGTYAIMLSEYSGLLGDMNNDGKLTAADAVAVLRYVVGLEDERRNISVADFDGDGKINARDASMILKRVVGLI